MQQIYALHMHTYIDNCMYISANSTSPAAPCCQNQLPPATRARPARPPRSPPPGYVRPPTPTTTQSSVSRPNTLSATTPLPTAEYSACRRTLTRMPSSRCTRPARRASSPRSMLRSAAATVTPSLRIPGPRCRAPACDRPI